MTSKECLSDPSAGPVLVLCGPEDPLTLVVAVAGKALAFEVLDASGRAMPVLAPAVARLLASVGLSTGDLCGAACVRGPGSFTGLRSILALGTGLALGAGIPMAGLDYLPVLARGASGASGSSGASPGRVFAVTYSRSAQVYLQGFHATPGAAPEPLFPPMVQSVAQAAEFLARALDDGPILVVGSGAVIFRQALGERLPGEAFAADSFALPDPAALAACAAELPASAWSAASPSPLYLRSSDAEENLAAIASARGLSPEKADRKLRDLTSRLPE